MADSTLREKGRERRRKLLGDATVERIEKTVYADPNHGKIRRSDPGNYLRRAVDTTRPGPENSHADLRDFGCHQRARCRIEAASAHGAQPGLDRRRTGGIAAAPRRLCRCAADPRGTADGKGNLRGDACGKMSAGEAWRQSIAQAQPVRISRASPENAEDRRLCGG